MDINLTLSLSHPGMSAFHKAGLAGLYMTIRALEKSKKKISGFTYELGPKTVLLRFSEDTTAETFDQLIRFAFQADASGLIGFPGLSIGGGQSFENRLLTHESVLGTFYQHGSHRTSTVEARNFAGEGDRPIVKPNFRAVTRYVAQNASELFIKKGKLVRDLEVIGWMFPGGAERHSGLTGTSLSEPVETALPLLFAPIGVIYLPVRAFESAAASKVKVCLLISTITNLEEYADVRAEIASMGETRLVMSGASEALLFLAEQFKIKKSYPMNELPLVTSIAMGPLGWVAGGQKVRTYVRSFRPPTEQALRNYEIVCATIKNQVIVRPPTMDKKGKEKEPRRSFVSVPLSRGLFAENITAGRYFYANFHTIFRPEGGKSHYKIVFEKGGLSSMLEKIEFDTAGERVFIEAIHEAWRRHLGKLGAISKADGSSFENRVGRDFERLRSSLARSKNAESVRENVTEFWARGGSLPALQENWDKVLPLFSSHNWKKARDLALLALASYKPREKHEAEAMEVISGGAIEEEEDE